MNATSTSLYSHKADISLTSLIQGIEGKHEHFASSFMGIAQNTGTPISTRLEAWRNPKTKMWQVDRITYVSMGTENDALIKKETIVRPGICFFDALHYLSVFEHTEKAMGKLASPLNIDGSKGNITHWRQAAKEAKQAIDADGFVQPCAYGRILVDGTFKSEEVIIARESPAPLSSGTSLVRTSMANDLLEGILTKGKPQVVQANLIESVQRRKSEAKKYDELIELGDKIIKTFNTIAENNFVSAYNDYSKEWDGDERKPLTRGTERKIKACLTFGISPLMKLIKEDVEYFPQLVLEDICCIFKKAAEKLADKEDPKLCIEFTKNVMFAFYIGRANSLYKADKFGKDGLKDIKRAAEIMGLSDTDSERLQAEYLDTGLQYNSEAIRATNICWSGYNNWNDRHGSGADRPTGLCTHLKSRKGQIERARALG